MERGTIFDINNFSPAMVLESGQLFLNSLLVHE
jgi:hypothetical protein